MFAEIFMQIWSFS